VSAKQLTRCSVPSGAINSPELEIRPVYHYGRASPSPARARPRNARGEPNARQ
jgi:hypothetical protein